MNRKITVNHTFGFTLALPLALLAKTVRLICYAEDCDEGNQKILIKRCKRVWHINLCRTLNFFSGKGAHQ